MDLLGFIVSYEDERLKTGQPFTEKSNKEEEDGF